MDVSFTQQKLQEDYLGKKGVFWPNFDPFLRTNPPIALPVEMLQ